MFDNDDFEVYLEDFRGMLSPQVQERLVKWGVRFRMKREAPRWGLCWIFGKVVGILGRDLRWSSRTTTIGRTVWLEDDFAYRGLLSQARLVEHEVQHVAQLRHWGPWYPLSYVLLLPLGLSMRGVWEWSAFRRDLRLLPAHFSREVLGELRKALIDRHVEILTGKSYFFALWLIKPFVRWRVRRFIEKL